MKFQFFEQLILTIFNFRAMNLLKKNYRIFWCKDTLSYEKQLLKKKGGVFNSFGGGILSFWGVLSSDQCSVFGKRII